MGTCGVAIKADVLRTVGAFMGGLVNAEDSDLWMRLGSAPGFAHIQSPAVFGYRVHSDTASTVEARTFEGVRRMVLKEQVGSFPGGTERQRERWHILTAHVRPVSLACLRRNELQQAFWLYRRTFMWHLRLGRLRYLVAMPLLAAVRWLQAAFRRRAYST